MTTKCRFSDCEWSGSLENIFDHYENDHPQYIRKSKGTDYYDFNFYEIIHEFLLCAPSGLYWFCSKPNADDTINCGIFHIGNSEPIYYSIKLGLNKYGFAVYLGPYKSLCAGTDSNYEVSLEYYFLQYLIDVLPTPQMRLYFKEHDDSYDMFSTTEEAEELNTKCVENFSCCVCYEVVKHNIRFCENVHYVCSNCYERMLDRGKLHCPICLANYPYACSDVAM